VLNANYNKLNPGKGLKTNTQVAVKTLKENADHAYLVALMSELKVMMYIGVHPNLVGLIGAITKKLRESKPKTLKLLKCNQSYQNNRTFWFILGELYLVLEHCKYGSLHDHLKNNRSKFINNFDELLTAKTKLDDRYD